MELSEILQSEDKFKYQLLSRMQQDCDYYLGNGNKSAKYLWAGNATEQIETMKAIWNSFPEEEKPEWLTWEEILIYEQQMA
jgi:hypothetical protein